MTKHNNPNDNKPKSAIETLCSSYCGQCDEYELDNQVVYAILELADRISDILELMEADKNNKKDDK